VSKPSRIWRLAAVGTLTLSPMCWPHAQEVQLPSPAFEVASIKPNTSGTTSMRINWSRGRFSAVNVTTRQFVEQAYKVEQFRLEGGPGWFNTDRFNIDATIPTDAMIVQTRGMPDEIRAMMQALLADRFMFRARWEQKQQKAYDLVLARRDGQLRPHLRKSPTDCQALIAAARQQGGPLPAPSVCGVQLVPGKLVATSYLMAQLADILTSSLEQKVIDRTGLAGGYDLDLTWVPDQTTDPGPSLFTALQEQLGLKLESTRRPWALEWTPDQPSQADAGGTQTDLSLPSSVFSAVQEQLGLKLESATGPVEVVVIDHVERPTPD